MSNPLVGRMVVAVTAVAVLASGAVRLDAADLTSRALVGWAEYVNATEARRALERPRPAKFMAIEFAGSGAADRRAILAGGLVVRRAPESTRGGRAIDISDALVHHWIGAVFVPGISLDALLAWLKEGPPPQADVLKASVLARHGDEMKVYLRLRRTKIVTVIYDTEHTVRFTRVDGTRASSTSVATKIVEIDQAGTSKERALPAGRDSGYLWRLNAYWRYESVDGGVLVECESLTLSRRVPFGLQTVASPIISSTARESMEAALRAVSSRGQVLP
jgi:hypothetical protein